MVHTPEQMVAELRAIDVDLAVLFPDHLLKLAVLPQAGYAAALARAYNAWLYDEWTFNYPQSNGKVVSSKTLVVPVNRQLDIHLTSLDVIHSFWVPEWRIKKDNVPGITTTAIVTPDKVGTYQLICTELCGFGHATMRALVKVVPKAQFESWLRRQPLVKPTPGSPNSASTGTSGRPPTRP